MNRHQRIVDDIKSTLEQHGRQPDELIEELGQTASVERRRQGHIFTLSEHIKGMVLAKLSSNRPWKPVAAKLPQLEEIFGGYDPSYLKAADPKCLTEKIQFICCGNRAIAKQMSALRKNIETLESIENLDSYVTSKSVVLIAKEFADGRYCLDQIGFALAMEYLRNVGVDAVKPDVHICRILSSERLDVVEMTSQKKVEEAAAEALSQMGKELGLSATYLDNLLWIFAAQDYGSICGSSPKCGDCLVRDCKLSTRKLA